MSNIISNQNCTEFFTVTTLVDITKTDKVRTYNKGMPEIEGEYELMRNQQRNWTSILQVIGLKTQPIFLTAPEMFKTPLYGFGELYENEKEGYAWQFRFGVEHEGVFGTPTNRSGILLGDLHNVPIITGLRESVPIEPAMFDTIDQNRKNTIII